MRDLKRLTSTQGIILLLTIILVLLPAPTLSWIGPFHHTVRTRTRSRATTRGSTSSIIKGKIGTTMTIASAKPKIELRRSPREGGKALLEKNKCAQQDNKRAFKTELELESHHHEDHEPILMMKDSSIITPTKDKKCSCDCEHHHDHESPRTVNIEEMLKVTRPSPSESRRQAAENPDEIAFVDEIDDLKKIQEESVQLAVWRQAKIPDFIHMLSDTSIQSDDLPAFEGLVLPGNTVGKHLKKCLGASYNLSSRRNVLDEDGMDQLVQHIEDLVNSFAIICRTAGFLTDEKGECPFVNVKLKVFEGNGCAYWHQDCVPFRMVATYRGPCTEYVPPVYSSLTLEQRKINSEHAQSLSHCDVALFKGRGNVEDSNAQRYDLPGIVHRSPQTAGSGISRLVLVVDIPQEGWHF